MYAAAAPCFAVRAWRDSTTTLTPALSHGVPRERGKCDRARNHAVAITMPRLMTETQTDPAVLPVIEVPPDEPARPIVAPGTPPAPVIEQTPRPRRPYLDLFLISFLILFFELAAIRWFGSTVVFLTFFTNIVLLAT